MGLGNRVIMEPGDGLSECPTKFRFVNSVVITKTDVL